MTVDTAAQQKGIKCTPFTGKFAAARGQVRVRCQRDCGKPIQNCSNGPWCRELGGMRPGGCLFGEYSFTLK